jgi:hypothetical protein
MEEDNLKKAIEFRGIVINRIPDKYKEIFKELAKEEFSDDYGNLLRQLLVSYFEYEQLKNMFLTNNLDVSLLINNKEEKVEEKSVRTNILGNPILLNIVKKEE